MPEAYIYAADIWCADCAAPFRECLPSDMDSDRYPQGPYAEGGGEADTPQHCAGCGEFLENPLTRDGERYVREAIAEHEETGRGTLAILEMWRDFYPEAFENA